MARKAAIPDLHLIQQVLDHHVRAGIWMTIAEIKKLGASTERAQRIRKEAMARVETARNAADDICECGHARSIHFRNEEGFVWCEDCSWDKYEHEFKASEGRIEAIVKEESPARQVEPEPEPEPESDPEPESVFVMSPYEPAPLVQLLVSCPKTFQFVCDQLAWAKRNRKRYLVKYLEDCLAELKEVI